jgi:thioredoxin reductase
MADVVIVGDGPAGLSAALFLAKRGMNVDVLGLDETYMHKALMLNYLGIGQITGSELMAIGREQVVKAGGRVHKVGVSAVQRDGEGFVVTADDGTSHAGHYLILATGTKREFAQSLGLALDDRGGVAADRDGRTAVDGLYCVGWSVRPAKIQAIISAGDGAAAALDILSREAGKELHDFDTVPAA